MLIDFDDLKNYEMKCGACYGDGHICDICHHCGGEGCGCCRKGEYKTYCVECDGKGTISVAMYVDFLHNEIAKKDKG